MRVPPPLEAFPDDTSRNATLSLSLQKCSACPGTEGAHPEHLFCPPLHIASYAASPSPRGLGLREDTDKALSADGAWETKRRIVHKSVCYPSSESEGLIVSADLRAVHYTWPPNEGILLMIMEHSLSARPPLNSLSQHLIQSSQLPMNQVLLTPSLYIWRK